MSEQPTFKKEFESKEGYLNFLQKRIIERVIGEELAQKIFKDLPPFTPIGLIVIREDNTFTCKLEVPAPHIALIQENNQLFITGQAVAGTKEMILVVEDRRNDNSVKIYQTLTQKSMLYIHEGSTEITIGEPLQNNQENGEFKICADYLPEVLKNLNTAGISIRNTIFSTLTLSDNSIIDCQKTSGIIISASEIMSKEDESMGQISPFSQVITFDDLKT